MNNKNEENEFLDIDRKHGKNYMIVVGILYLLVIILTIFLVIGIKKQKDVVKSSLNEDVSNQEKINNNEEKLNNKVEEKTDIDDSTQSDIKDTNNPDDILNLLG